MIRRFQWLAALAIASACTVSTVPASSQPYSPPPPREERRPPPPRSEPAPVVVAPAPVEPMDRDRDRDRDRRPSREEPQWDHRGWISLGEHTVDGRVDEDQFDFSQKQGKISKIMVVVLDGDVEVLEFRIVSVTGNVYNPQTKHFFRDGSRTRPIDLPKTEILRAVQLKYRNLGRDHARVQVWAR
jgi:hypothetical protein